MANLSLVFDLLARDKASAEFRKVGDAAERAGKQGDGFGSSVAKGMKLAAGAVAAAGLGSLFAGFVQDAAESAKISRLTEAAIKSTGGAANISADQVGELATAISNKTAVDDEAIQSASNLLLTFTNVRNEVGKGNDIFNQATQAATDMSVALGTEPKQAALQLGKALNDPIKGVTALGRAGVQFTAQQKEQIKTLVESGDTLGAQKIILGELQTQFGGAAAAAADPLERLKVIAGNLGETLGGYLLPVVGKIASFISDTAIPAIAKWSEEMRVRLAPVVASVSEFIRERIVPAVQDFGDFLTGTAVPAIREFGEWVNRNREWLLPLAAALVGAKVALIAYNTYLLLISKATKIWTAIQAAFNVVMKANPIMLVVSVIGALVAAVVVAYNTSDKFRSIVDAAFRAVAAAGRFMWDNVLKPAFTALQAAWRVVAAGIAAAWSGIIRPAWEALRAAFLSLWNSVLKPTFAAIASAWRALGAAIDAAWRTIIRPAWDAIRAAAAFLWNSVLKPTFSFIAAAWSTLARGIASVWTGVIRPAWSAVQDAARYLWNNILRPVFDAIGRGWSTLSSGISTVWTRYIKPVFIAFSEIGETVRRGFSTAINGITRLWQGLKDTLRAPIQAVVDVVWNNGIRKLWNTVNNLWGGSDLASVRLARGGVLPGYTPGRDVHRFYSSTGGILDLSGGEAVMRPEFTRVLGKPTIDALNSIARREGEAGLVRAMEHGMPHQAHAAGGITEVPSWVKGIGSGLLSFFGGATGTGIALALQKDVNTVNGANLGGGLLGSALVGVAKNMASRMWAKAKEMFDGASAERTGGGGSFGPAPGGGSLGSSYTSMYAAIKAAFPEARLNSGYRPGDPGYHGRGKAVDIGWSRAPGGIGNAFMASVNRWLYDRHRGSLAELIYNGLGDDRPNWWKGQNYAYSYGTQLQHRNHVHAAVYDTGGVLPPGLTLAYNGTGRNEYVTKREPGPVVINVNGTFDLASSNDLRRAASVIRKELVALERAER